MEEPSSIHKIAEVHNHYECTNYMQRDTGDPADAIKGVFAVWSLVGLVESVILGFCNRFSAAVVWHSALLTIAIFAFALVMERRKQTPFREFKKRYKEHERRCKEFNRRLELLRRYVSQPDVQELPPEVVRRFKEYRDQLEAISDNLLKGFKAAQRDVHLQESEKAVLELPDTGLGDIAFVRAEQERRAHVYLDEAVDTSGRIADAFEDIANADIGRQHEGRADDT